MARSKGRVIISKVDSSGNKIRSLKVWLALHPGELYFDSKVEWEVWKYLSTSNINFTNQPSLLLFDTVTTAEFQKPRKSKNNPDGDREIKNCTQRKIQYTPDYYLNDFDVYIEVKGYADEVFKLRWKLFKLKGYNGYIVYSLKEFKQLYKQLQSMKKDDKSRDKI